MDPVAQNALAAQFRALHNPKDTLILGNVFDATTASIIASLPTSKAVATASFAIAATQGIDDDDMTMDQNFNMLKNIAKVVVPTGKPLTADLQDGYEDVKATIQQAIALGVVGCNLEDVDSKARTLRSLDDAVARIKLALQAAKEAQVPQFAINARTDVLGHGGTIEDAIERGQAYLKAGANTVFVWGGPKGRGVSREEVEKLVAAFDGRLNVIKRFGEGFLSVSELKTIGVARISVGPGLYRIAMNAYKEAAENLLSAGI
ncbi:MAG: phosphoenolpyruvate phosphomutase-domain-containing protein [Benniella sp.]|nr:MAG: phosphoenolpyruvate phosphomutase-domain-containing protein [Benniella sp.]